jgi:hypothetical protein
MSTPYRALSAPERELAAAAALPPDAYRPLGLWALVGRRFAVYVPVLGLAYAVFLYAHLGALGLGGVVVAYAWLLVDVFRRRRLALRVARASDDAVAQLYGGDLDGAARALDQLAVQSRGLGFYHAVAVFNRGVAFLRQAEPEKALALFHAVDRSGWFERFKTLGFDALLASAQATACATLDDVTAAEGHLARAQARTAPSSRGRVLLAEALVGLRKGEHRAVAARIDAEWPAAEAVLPATHLRTLRALQAWALVRSGADEAAVARAVERARPVRHGEHDHVAARWPELKAFFAERVEGGAF